MKVIHVPTPEHIGWYVQCQGCHRVLEIEHPNELWVDEPGDMKDEATLAFGCVVCLHVTKSTHSRLKGESAALRQRYARRQTDA